MERFSFEALRGLLRKTGKITAAAFRELVSSEESGGDGNLTARGRLARLFDEGTFTETGIFVRRRTDEFDTASPDEFEGVVTGWGAVDGCLVYAFAQDLSRTDGSVSEAHAKKICDIYRLALENGAPIVGFFDSRGAYIPEGVNALAGYGRIMKASSSASGIIPQIAVISGYCTGAAAVIASMFDLTVVSGEGGVISVNPPFLAEGAGKAEFASETGVAAIVAENDAYSVDVVKNILGMIPENNESPLPYVKTVDSPERASDLSSFAADRDMRKLVSEIADDGRVRELYPGYAEELEAALISLGGTPVGVIALDGGKNGGKLTADAARKAKKTLSVFDSFGMPVLTIVDSDGLDVSTDAERASYASSLAGLASAYCTASSPLVTLIAGEAYGSVFTVMGSKSVGADTVIALESAKIAAMKASSAVAFLFNDKISAEVTREDLETSWNDNVASPVEAASSGEIDDVIAPDEVRARLCAAFNMLSRKSRSWNSRRHPNMPL